MANPVKISESQGKEKAPETARRLFTEYLERNDHRKTGERFAILEYVYKQRMPFDIEMLYAYMQENYHVSRTTLYNTLNLLQKCNLVVKRQIGSIIKYERVIKDSQTNHYILICSNCGNMKRMSDEQIKRVIEHKPLRGFEVSHFSLYVYGLCAKCGKKITKP
jgi:Fur family ferric uptake transcriptional regulator